MEITTIAIEVIPLRYDPGAHDVILERDIPKPPLPLHIRHRSRAFIHTGITLCSFVVRPNGDLVKLGITLPPFLLPLKKGIATRRIHRHGRPHFKNLPRLILRSYTNNYPILLYEIQDLDPLPHVGSRLACSFHHHGVESRPIHLPGFRPGMIGVFGKIERRRKLTIRIHKLHALLALEACPIETIHHPNSLQRVITMRNQRLAHVIARKMPLLQDDYFLSLLP